MPYSKKKAKNIIAQNMGKEKDNGGKSLNKASALVYSASTKKKREYA